MLKIKQLPEHIISKIAAGEVIERPVFAVKELIENSLDANAKSIIIQTEQAGLKNITVIDDGEGMSAPDALECFKAHTTSKIYSEESMHKVATLGFRGEALSSIAAVSQMIIKTKPKNTLPGTIIELNEGKLTSTSSIGIPPGTYVSINNLFSNIPARKKFLKNNAAESRQITDLVIQYALAFPKTHFQLIHNKKTVFDLPNNLSLIERIKILLGTNIYENLIPVDYQDSYLQIYGFLIKPQLTFFTNHKQFIFVNQRRISNKMISLAVKEAYGNLIEATNFPAFILSFKLPYEMVDVNIHPRKENISFLNSRFVFDSIYKSIQETLTQHNLTFSNLTWKDKLGSSTKTYTGKLLKEAVLPWDIRDNEVLDNSEILQLQNLYLVSQLQNGILIVDQHAAHERILFEQYLQEFLNQKNNLEKIQLINPLTFELSISEASLLTDNLKTFKKFGFDIELFKDQTFSIYAIPELFQERNIQESILEMLEDLSTDKSFKNLDDFSNKIIEYLACRTAIKAGEKLTQDQAKKLIEQLEKTANNYTCPHGRPTKIVLNIDQLHHSFKRK